MKKIILSIIITVVLFVGFDHFCSLRNSFDSDAPKGWYAHPNEPVSSEFLGLIDPFGFGSRDEVHKYKDLNEFLKKSKESNSKGSKVDNSRLRLMFVLDNSLHVYSEKLKGSEKKVKTFFREIPLSKVAGYSESNTHIRSDGEIYTYYRMTSRNYYGAILFVILVFAMSLLGFDRFKYWKTDTEYIRRQTSTSDE